MPIFGQKTSILLKLHYFMVIKVNRMLFLFRFSTRKSLLSCPYFLKNTSILLKHTAFIPILVKKRPFSQKHGALMCFFFFFKFFMKNSCCRAHDWSKNVNSVKTTLYSGPKKSIWCPFFLFLTKITALMSIFCQKTFIL